MKRLVVLLLLMPWPLQLGGCLHSPQVEPPAPIEMPDAYSEKGTEAPRPDRWWIDFNDPQLTELVDRALSDNFQMKIAWSRLAQADALARQAMAGIFPSLSLDASANHSRRISNFPSATGGTAEVVIESPSYGLSVGAAYEVDIWGKNYSRMQAGGFDHAASRDDLESIAMTTAAQVAETWFGLVTQRAQVDLIRRQLETNATFLELITLRYDQGLSTSLDVYQQRQEVASSRGQLATAEAQRRVLEHQLSVLVGRPPQEVVSGDRQSLPQLPALPGIGLPAELIARRPDVRAAQRRVTAADYRVGVALTELLPSIRLTGSIGFGAPSLESLFSDIVWNFVAGLTQPLFEGGRRLAELDRTKAALQERVHGFGNTVVQALMEVENALAQEEQQLQQLEQIHAQREHASNALREARERYTAGLTDFLRVLTALQSLQRVEQSVLQAERQLLSNRIQLCRALGGTWTADLPPAGEAS